MNERLLIAIPSYNCAEQIGRVLAQVTSDYCDFVSEVLVIDNRSADEL